MLKASAIPAEMRRVRMTAGLTQEEFGRMNHMSASAVSMAERGDRPLTPEMRRVVSLRQHDQRLALAIAEEATGGMSPPPLNRPRCDLTPIGSGVKVDEDIETVVALRPRVERIMVNVSNPAHLTPEQRAVLVEYQQAQARLMTAMANHMHSVCETAGIDPATEVWWPVRDSLRTKHMILAQKKARRNGRSRHRGNGDGPRESLR